MENGRNNKFLAQNEFKVDGVDISKVAETNELLHVFNSFQIVYYEKKENDPSDKFDQSVYMVAIKK